MVTLLLFTLTGRDLETEEKEILCELGSRASPKGLTIEEYLMWSVDNPLSSDFLCLLFQVRVHLIFNIQMLHNHKIYSFVSKVRLSGFYYIQKVSNGIRDESIPPILRLIIGLENRTLKVDSDSFDSSH